MIFQSLYSQCSDWKIIALFLKSAPFAAFLHNIIFFTKMIMMNFRFFQQFFKVSPFTPPVFTRLSRLSASSSTFCGILPKMAPNSNMIWLVSQSLDSRGIHLIFVDLYCEIQDDFLVSAQFVIRQVALCRKILGQRKM